MPVEKKRVQAKIFNTALFGDEEFDQVVEKKVEAGQESSNSYMDALRSVTMFEKERSKEQGDKAVVINLKKQPV